jgi:hypothetical protein
MHDTHLYEVRRTNASALKQRSTLTSKSSMQAFHARVLLRVQQRPQPLVTLAPSSSS